VAAAECPLAPLVAAESVAACVAGAGAEALQAAVGWEAEAVVEAETAAAAQAAVVAEECVEVEVGGGGAHLAPLAVELAAAETA
jgi:hypothetical protein